MDAVPSAEFVWQPDEDDLANANLTRFQSLHGIDSFDHLLRRSTEDVAWFTEAVLEFLDIRFRVPYSKIINTSNGIARPEWCVDGVMNIIDNCLDKYIDTPVENQIALRWESEQGSVEELTYAELNTGVSQMANGLRSLRFGPGDAIGIYMPMVPEIVIALLAIAKIGAVALPLFSGYGAGAVAGRLRDADAVALITADGFQRRGSWIEMFPIAMEAVARTDTIKQTIVLERGKPTNFSEAENVIPWSELIQDQPNEAETAATQAEDVLMILYTSGTTGRPKGAVHTHCGFPIKAAQDMAFGMDVHPGDVIYWMTDMGWMMGPWLIFGSLLLQGTMLLYEGAPDFPGPDRVWAMVERHSIHSLGLSPTFVRAVKPLGDAPVRAHDLSSLRLFGSTGEPWNPDPWLWLFEVVGERKRPIINYSGGTEISGGILMGSPTLPIKPCAFSAPCPGIAANIFDEFGEALVGEVGELVITKPWIGMTRGFWKDPDRYHQTYWSKYPEVWVHGDWAMIDKDGMWFIMGRSDDTIKIAGKRLGPAEVESILVEHPSVAEAAAIAVPDEIKGSALVCFCVLIEDAGPEESLEGALTERVINELGKPLKPSRIVFVADLPKTRNAKVMRRMIRASYLGEDLGDTSALVNPDSLDELKSTGIRR